MDAFIVAVGIGLAGSVVAGPALAGGVRLMPLRWQHSARWLVIATAVGFALSIDRIPGAVAIYVLAASPGVVAYLAFRTLLAPAFVSLVPMYFVIGHLTRDWPTERPEVAWDAAFPLRPAWMLVYGSLYTFSFLMPLLVIRQPGLLRQVMKGYLFVMTVSYLGFLLYPTVAPRPDIVSGDGFAAWSLRLTYSMDPPYGCFPSLHVAYAVVAALGCSRVHRRIGIAAGLWATLIAVSTLFTKQHYLVDVVAGALLAGGASWMFLRGHQERTSSPEERRLAAQGAAIAAALYGVMVAGLWISYLLEPGR